MGLVGQAGQVGQIGHEGQMGACTVGTREICGECGTDAEYVTGKAGGISVSRWVYKRLLDGVQKYPGVAQNYFRVI